MQLLADKPLRDALENAAEQIGNREVVEVDTLEGITWHGLIWAILEYRLRGTFYRPEDIVEPYEYDGLKLTMNAAYHIEHSLSHRMQPVAEKRSEPAFL